MGQLDRQIRNRKKERSHGRSRTDLILETQYIVFP